MTKVSARKGPLITKKMIKISFDETETDDENVKEMFKKLKDLIESKSSCIKKVTFKRHKQIFLGFYMKFINFNSFIASYGGDKEEIQQTLSEQFHSNQPEETTLEE